MRKIVILAFSIICFIFSFSILYKVSTEYDNTLRTLNSSVFIHFSEKGKDTGKGYFSGTLISSQEKNYIITCGHAFEEYDKHVDEIVVIRNIMDDYGSITQSQSSLAHIIQLSLSEESGGCDIAILELEDKLSDKGAIFYKFKLKVLTDFLHVGNPYGTYINAAVPGKISVVDLERTYEKNTTHFVIVSCEIREGCSGGGIFINGRYAGMVLRADKYGYGLIRDVKYIKQYLEEHDLGFIAKGK